MINIKSQLPWNFRLLFASAIYCKICYQYSPIINSSRQCKLDKEIISTETKKEFTMLNI